jgi:DNA-binding MarR family transcriptional regulator
MTGMRLSEFADRVNEIMPIILKEYLRHNSGEVINSKITMPQFYILDFLKRQGESKMSDLARIIGVSTAAVTGIADRLVRDKLVVRVSDPGDRRIVKIRLTPAGKDMAERIVRQRKDITIRIFSKISDSEREEYLRILEHIKEHLNGNRS